LNVLPPKVWPQCDGETSVAGIVVALGEDEHAAAIVAPTAAHESCLCTAPSALLAPRAACHILA
jgi:LDH2 family malate/lactate/ureidoglycolate dehydrogenase